MGRKQLNKVRAEVIAAHSKVITKFVQTSDTPFGKIALQKMFEAADANGDGQLSKEEVRVALQALGFSWIADKQAGEIFKRADKDDSGDIDFEEFVNETPDPQALVGRERQRNELRLVGRSGRNRLQLRLPTDQAKVHPEAVPGCGFAVGAQIWSEVAVVHAEHVW